MSKPIRILLLALLFAGGLAGQTLRAGSLVGTLTELTHNDLVDLTDLGSTDWTVYGLGGTGFGNGSLVPDSRRDAGGGTAVGAIGDLALLLGNESLTDGGQFAYAPLFGWTDGTPLVSQTANVGDETDDAGLMVRNQSAGAGFSLSLPADTTERSALIYIGAFHSTGQFQATLSDSSSASFVPAPFSHTSGIDRVGVYRLDYLANSANQTLDLRWEQTVDGGSNNMVSISGIALTTPGNLPADPIDPLNPLFKPGVTIGNATGTPALTGGALTTAASDLNLDGIPEIVTASSRHSSDPHFRIHSRNTNNSWDSIDVLSTNEVRNNRPDRFGGDSIIIDMNNDQYPDILLPESSNGAGAGKLSWFENPATADLTGTWNEHVIGTWDGSSGADKPAHLSEIYAGDMDGDGDVDVVTRDINNGVHILSNEGGGVFSRHFLATNPREGLDLFDPDQDGDLDILLNGVWFEAPDPGAGGFADLSDTGSFTRHDITPDGVSNSPWYPDVNNYAAQRDYAVKALAADLNGDGIEDVVFTNAEELTNNSDAVKPEGISVFLADGVGGDDWTEIQLQTHSRKLHNLDAVDVDLDGDLDLLSGISKVGKGNDPPEVFVYLNGGDGTTWTKVVVDNVNIYSGVFGDFDGDGDADIVGPDNWKSGVLRFFESNATQLLSSLPGDYNNDGQVDAADLAAWEAAFGTSVTNAFEGSDGDGDQDVDGADFLLWQRHFGESISSAQAAGTQVPEPTTAWLIGLAGVIRLLNSRKKGGRGSCRA